MGPSKPNNRVDARCRMARVERRHRLIPQSWRCRVSGNLEFVLCKCLVALFLSSAPLLRLAFNLSLLVLPRVLSLFLLANYSIPPHPHFLPFLPLVNIVILDCAFLKQPLLLIQLLVLAPPWALRGRRALSVRVLAPAGLSGRRAVPAVLPNQTPAHRRRPDRTTADRSCLHKRTTMVMISFNSLLSYP